MEEKLPERRPTRLPNVDYSVPGAYFVTVCTQDRKRLLSEIVCSPSAVTAATPTNEMLPRVISAFKRLSAKEIGNNIFQRGYYDHIVRDREDYETRKKYLFENPLRWYYKYLHTEK